MRAHVCIYKRALGRRVEWGPLYFSFSFAVCARARKIAIPEKRLCVSVCVCVYVMGIRRGKKRSGGGQTDLLFLFFDLFPCK